MTDTLTNEPSTTTTSPYEAALAKTPAWLNLPALLDEGMVLDLAAKADEVEALADTVSQAMQTVHRLILSFDAATTELEGDEVLAILRQITGMDRLWNAVQSIVDNACVVTGSVSNEEPEWMASMVADLRATTGGDERTL